MTTYVDTHVISYVTGGFTCVYPAGYKRLENPLESCSSHLDALKYRNGKDEDQGRVSRGKRITVLGQGTGDRRETKRESADGGMTCFVPEDERRKCSDR